jgi:AraC-like DNA-binding protein
MWPRNASRGHISAIAMLMARSFLFDLHNTYMSRRRQVRFCYPTELMQLAMLLSARYRMREVSTALGIPRSTHYRWLAVHGRSMLQRPSDMSSCRSRLCELIDICETYGFHVRDGVAHLTSIHVSDEKPAAEAAGKNLQAHMPDQRKMAVSENSIEQVIFRSADLKVRKNYRRTGNEIVNRLQLVRNKINAEYFLDWSCEQFGRLVKMSKCNLINRFTAAYGISPYRYLLMVRIHHAKRLLKSMQEPLDTIAIAVGFDTPSSLAKSFKAIEGVTLSDFYRGLRFPYTAAAIEAAPRQSERRHRTFGSAISA